MHGPVLWSAHPGTGWLGGMGCCGRLSGLGCGVVGGDGVLWFRGLRCVMVLVGVVCVKCAFGVRCADRASSRLDPDRPDQGRTQLGGSRGKGAARRDVEVVRWRRVDPANRPWTPNGELGHSMTCPRSRCCVRGTAPPGSSPGSSQMVV